MDLFKQTKGYVTDVIKVPEGFLILKVDERYEKGTPSYEEVENEITQVIAEPRVEPRLREFLTKLRAEAFLEIRAGYVDTRRRAGQGHGLEGPGAAEARRPPPRKRLPRAITAACCGCSRPGP